VTARAAIGLDVGGTKVLGVALGAAGDVIVETRRRTPHDPDGLLDALERTAADLAERAEEDLDGVPIGVGLPGLISVGGVLVASPNIPGVTQLDIRGELQRRLGRPVAVSNDATCAVLAEWRRGAGRGNDDIVMVTLGTGIGGGVVSGGRLIVGAHGFTGEFGHMVIDPNGPACPCGRRGCWERYASGSGLAYLARLAAAEGRAARIVELAGGDDAAIRGEHVHVAAAEGDAEARAVIDTFGRWVALGLANLTNAFDPAAFVLGGGLAEGAELYLPPIERWYHDLLYAPDLRPRPALSFASLGERAGAIGAALLALEGNAGA
jgi:glucokinase